MKKLFYLSFIVLSLLVSCNEDNITSDKKSGVLTARLVNEDDKPDEPTQIVLGEKLANPYSVSNMKAAFKYYNSVISDSPFKDKVVKATHYYIKIIPSTLDDLEFLDSLDNSDDDDALVLQDYPLDYEILKEGDYYVYPKDEKDLYYPIYTVIPVDYVFDKKLHYEILDSIYEPTEEEYDVETVAMFFAGWDEDLKVDGIEVELETLPDYLKKSFDADNSASRIAKKYRPSGYVKIEDTNTTNSDVYVPLQQVKISIGRNIFWKYTYTDDSGYFSAPKKYRGKVRIRAKWRGYTATIRRTWNEILGIQVSDHLMTLTRGSNGSTKTIAYNDPGTGLFGIDLRGGHLWYKGTVHNGLRRYIDYCNSNGISHTTSYANVWAWASGENCATPMLHKYPQLRSISEFANIGEANVWSVMLNTMVGKTISLFPAHLRPDHIFANLKSGQANTDGRSSTLKIHQVVAHESGHYSHACKAGAQFWAKVFATEISNSISTSSLNSLGNPYSDGSEPSYEAGKRIALAEGWATLVEFKASLSYYRQASFNNDIQNSSLITSGLENFISCDIPIFGQRDDGRGWFLHGIMWDMLDNNKDTREIATRVDTSGHTVNQIDDSAFIGNTSNEYDLSSIFKHLNGDVNSVSDLNGKVMTANPTQAVNLKKLYISYYGEQGVNVDN